MTYKEYFEDLGCSPDEAEVCIAASKARYRRELEKAADMIEDGCILMDDHGS